MTWCAMRLGRAILRVGRQSNAEITAPIGVVNQRVSRFQRSALATASSTPCSRFGIVVDLDDVDAVGRLLEIDAVEAVADEAGGADADVEHFRRHLVDRERARCPPSMAVPFSRWRTICQCFLAIVYWQTKSG